MKCGAEDASEICLADCRCICHAAFWKAYEEAEAPKG